MKTWQQKVGAATLAVGAAVNPVPANAFKLNLDKLIRDKVEEATGVSIPQKGDAGQPSQTPQTPQPVGGKQPVSIPVFTQGSECPDNATNVSFDTFQEACRKQIELPKGQIPILDAKELLQRASADMQAMQNVERAQTKSALDCLGGATSRTDPRMAKCVQESDQRGDSEVLKGIYTAKTIISPQGIVQTARAVLGKNEMGQKTAVQVLSGVRTVKASPVGSPLSAEDAHLGWVTIVDTSKTKLPPGTRVTRYDDYVKSLSAMVQKYPEEQYRVEMHEGFDRNDTGAPPPETVKSRNIFGGSQAQVPATARGR